MKVAIAGVERGEQVDGDDVMNSARSLPRYDLIKSGEAIRRELLESRTGGEAKVYDGVLVLYRQTRNMFTFFKEGLVNVWRVHRDLRRHVFNGRRYLVDYSKGNVDGKLVLRRGDYVQLVDELSERVALLGIEAASGHRTFEDYVGAGEPQIGLTRREFVEMVRDRENVYKLPLFGVLFLVFEELSLPLVYLFPQMLPTTCVMPGWLERRYYARHRAGLATLARARGEQGAARYLQDIALNRTSAYSIGDKRELRAVCDSLLCRGTTAAQLHLHQKTLAVDDYLIVAGGGVASLGAAELVHGCRARGLAPGLGVGPADVDRRRALLAQHLERRLYSAPKLA